MHTTSECIERAQKQLDKVDALDGLDLVIVDDKDILRAALQMFIIQLENLKPNERHRKHRSR